MKKIKYTRNKCIGCGICIAEASNVFAQNSSDGRADLLDSEPVKNYSVRILWDDELQVLQSIVKLCPVKAIQIL